VTNLTDSHEINSEALNFPLVADTILQNRYRVVRQLGRGGMGAVYEAIDQRLGITVALKETLSAEPSMRRQFEHEARLLAGMQHPALPRVSDHFVEDNRAFLVMQYIGGTDLARIISQQPGPFPREQVIAWADQLLDALIYLHSRDRQVIHRDIKPHNLKVSATGQIALLDFGLAKAQPSDASVTSSQAFFGYTRHYAPLEQIQDQRTDPRSDIYALGATLYHLLTGIKPPDALIRASALVSLQADPLKAANEIHAAVGPQVAAILLKAMAQRPEDRYASATEFREAFRQMGRTKEIASVIDHKIEAGVLAQPPPAGGVSFDMAETHTVVKGSIVQLAMVESARRFGPGAMTAVLVSLVMLAAGALYGSPGWFQSNSKDSSANSAAVVAERSPATSRKVDRQIPAEKNRAVRSDLVATAAARPAKEERKREAPVAAPLRPEVSLRRAQPAVDSKPSSRQRVNPPSIRLPNPEFPSSAPARSNDSPRAFRISSSANVPAGPKFYRAADGTQTVRFSDGSTQVVRPGHQSAQLNGSYR
jgi:serine/threonine protein kinase